MQLINCTNYTFISQLIRNKIPNLYLEKTEVYLYIFIGMKSFALKTNILRPTQIQCLRAQFAKHQSTYVVFRTKACLKAGYL